MTTGGVHARRAEGERMSVDKFQVQDGYECPTCENVLNTSLGLKQHHTKVHGESLQPTSECQWCGDTFRHGPTREANFCSKECQMERRKSEGVPANRRRVKFECDNCGAVESVPKSDIEHGKRYCSTECRWEDSNAKDIVCEQCNDTFRATGKWANDARFCSQDCYGVWLSENKSGADSWHWRGDERSTERPGYGPGWTERKREIVRNRDRRRCTECGLREETHIEKHGEKLHVHHEVIAREAANPAVYNAPRNLRTLCISCHLSRH